MNIVIKPLDHQLHACHLSRAVFMGIDTQESEILETYDSRKTTAAETWAENTPTHPIGYPETTGTNELALKGFKFKFNPTEECWEHDAAEFSIRISPTVDLQQAEELLKSIQDTKPLLNRKTLHRDPLRIKIGTIPKKPRIAYAQGRRGRAASAHK